MRNPPTFCRDMRKYPSQRGVRLTIVRLIEVFYEKHTYVLPGHVKVSVLQRCPSYDCPSYRGFSMRNHLRSTGICESVRLIEVFVLRLSVLQRFFYEKHTYVLPGYVKVSVLKKCPSYRMSVLRGFTVFTYFALC